MIKVEPLDSLIQGEVKSKIVDALPWQMTQVEFTAHHLSFHECAFGIVNCVISARCEWDKSACVAGLWWEGAICSESESDIIGEVEFVYGFWLYFGNSWPI